MKSRSLKFKVWSENACFTRPEMKVERVSYDVITPSAARGIAESILWKPAIEWSVEKIEVLNPVRWESVRRNEVQSKIPYGTVERALNSGSGSLQLYIEEERTQRAGLLLRDVSYIVHLHFNVTAKAGAGDNVTKFEDMFDRRVTRGQFHHMPCMGCREFPAFFAPVDGTETPIPESRDLGYMLYDMDFSTPDNVRPMFFRAEMRNGVVDVPARGSAGVFS